MKNKHKMLFNSEGEVLGKLVSESMDFPWVLGEFIASEKYSEYEELFSKEVTLTKEIDELEDLLDSGPDEESQNKLEKLENEKGEIEEKIDDLGLYTQDSEGENRSDVVTIHIDGNKFEYK